MLLSTTPLHASEALRLQALQDTRLLDSADDPHFDTVVESTLRFCQTPMAALSLVDQDRQWFKSSYGLDVHETPRHHGLCAQTILHNDLLLVEDASIDPRFCDNPLVIGPTHLRFYAGYPIHAGPHRLPVGTLCVLDSAPRTLTEAQQQRLRTAAGLLSVMLDVQASNHAVQHFLEHSSEPMLLQCHEPTGPLLRANAATLLLTGFDAPTISQMGLSGLLQLGQPSAEVAIIERAIAQQRYACTTLQFSHASGRELTCELQLFPLFGQPSRQVLLLAPLPSNSLHTFFSALRLQDRQMLLALSVDSFWATDVELRLTEVAGRVFIGGEFEQVAVAYGKRPWEFPFADPDSADFDMLRQAWHKRQAFKNFEYALLWQGRTIWLSVSGYPVFDSDGEFVGFRGTNRDISSRKAISEALRQSDEQLRLLAYNTSDGLAVLEKGCIVFVSPSYLKLLGLPDAQALGTDEAAMLRLIHPDDQSRVVAILRDSISKKHSSCSLTCRVLHRDGHILWREDAYRFTYSATWRPDA